MMHSVQPSFVIGTAPPTSIHDISQGLPMDAPIHRIPLIQTPNCLPKQSGNNGLPTISQSSGFVRHSGQTVFPRRGSPSPDQWRASLDTLSADLSRICRAPVASSGNFSASLNLSSKSIQSNPASKPVMHTLQPPSLQLRPLSADLSHSYRSLDRNSTTRASVGQGRGHGQGQGRGLEKSSQNRQIRVRHEETEMKLKQSLTAICGMGINSTPSTPDENKLGNHSGALDGGSSIDSTSSPSAHSILKKSPQVQLKESLKSGVRVKLGREFLYGENQAGENKPGENQSESQPRESQPGESQCDVQNLMVCVSLVEKTVSVYHCGKSQDNTDTAALTTNSAGLAAESASCTAANTACTATAAACTADSAADRTRLISCLNLPDPSNISILMGSVVGSVLYVRERQKLVLLDYSNESGHIGIPVIHEDEPAMCFTVTVPIAPEYYAKLDKQSGCLIVKTVDDSLIIKGLGVVEGIQNQPINSYNSNENSTQFSSVQDDVRGKITRSGFSIAMKLPDGSDSRSVCAELSPNGLLIIRGVLNPSSRRMTCNF